ncbi:unnamed protein product [marine sediment metagenome]|uniref:Uncharacterized protein n=1 Tax=marine sediment metagenome TaxID=412755 RepID=X1CLD8_9ZZZZ
MPTYRKRKSGKTWHWCTNCSNWPPDDSQYDEVVVLGRPTYGELCDRCKRNEKFGNCEMQ